METLAELIEGLKIIQKYEPDAAIDPAHDEILVGDASDEMLEKYTEEDKKLLELYGFSINNEWEMWHKFT